MEGMEFMENPSADAARLGDANPRDPFLFSISMVECSMSSASSMVS